jgi:hypothetical protein
MGAGDEVGLALLLQSANDGTADHTAVACYVDFVFYFIHGLNLSRTCLQIERCHPHPSNSPTAPQ